MHSLANCIAALLAVLPTPGWASQAPPAAPEEETIFTVLAAGRQVGVERVRVIPSEGGWLIDATGTLAPPFDLMTRRFQARYDADWRPLRLAIEATFRDEPYRLTTTVENTTATSEVLQGRETTTEIDTVSPDAILLPNNFYAAYEALSVRLANATPGTRLPVYVAPTREIPLEVMSVEDERIATPAREILARRYRVTFRDPARPVTAEITADEENRVIRVTLPSLQVVRADVAAVSARSLTLARATDEEVRIPALGFSLAATLSRPSSPPAGRLPAIVLVPGAGFEDRDETVAGISVFGQLANTLADAGFLVVRYDKRGVGQSGGRPESSGLAEYVADVRAIVRFLDDRDDVDMRRLVLLGYGDGGAVSLLASARENKIDASVLVASLGTSGADLILEQQRHALDRLGLPDAEKTAKIELQQQIQSAVMQGGGWDGIPDEIRRQADTPWFRSFLSFEPAEVMRRVRQPLMIVHGDLDTQVPPHHADRLAELARARPRQAPVELVRLAGVNHLLVPALTGEVDEYERLPDRTVSPDVTTAIVEWLGDILQ